MKKLLLGALLLLSVSLTAQSLFVKKYTSVVTMNNNVVGEWQSINLTVVFNANKDQDVIFYYENGSKRIFHQTTPAKKGETTDGSKYQIIEAVTDDDGKHVALQLFDDDKCLRVLVGEGSFVEFHKE